MTWKDAQMCCRKYHDDLSTVNKEEAQLLSGNTDFTYRLNWIGLYISPNNPGEWIWSGGEVEAIDNWDSGQPDDFEECGGLKQSTSKLHDIPCSQMQSFYCMEVVGPILVHQNKTWDEALDYCRKKYTDLASVSSESIMAEVINNTITSQTVYVWTGLRFMAGHWFWLSGDDLQYKSWSPEGELQCPARNLRCGALNRDEKTIWIWTGGGNTVEVSSKLHIALCFWILPIYRMQVFEPILVHQNKMRDEAMDYCRRKTLT
ncbi:Macrophage mannose receptor 1 [Anabarilius grahami]|uniref:Macrophage mannose receptor 1 n=1 Tax=Anabarilius grahami TaxID=495550 RepID=A0A3N0Z683_ANAGA|nr:Macrophage mannose receptor 1 [Anabarilius grahami]